MQNMTLFMLVVVTLFEFLAKGDRFGNGGFLPGFISFFAELSGALAMAYVIVVGTRNRFQFVRPAYWLAFGTMLLIIICGVAVNSVSPGPIIAGLRMYLRAIPWFFVPAIFAYSDGQLRKQLKWLLVICAMQIPLAIRQRIQTADSSWGFVAVTGDWTTGTIGDSGMLSVFLVCGACLLAACYERKLLKLTPFVLMFMGILVPTMINETKAMVAFLPVSLAVAFTVAARPEVRAKRLVSGFAFLLLFGAIFVPVYDALNKDRKYGSSLGDFFLQSDKVGSYVSSDLSIGTDKEAGRGDCIVVPLRALSHDLPSLIFGYGIGNASDSSLGLAFGGKYAATFRPFLQISFAKFVLELGLAGVLTILFIYWLIFKDCLAVARSDKGIWGAIAAGWSGVIPLMGMTMFYNKAEVFPALSFLFWYFSGLIAARRMRMVSTDVRISRATSPAGLGAPLLTN
jgi:hypothetical protein